MAANPRSVNQFRALQALDSFFGVDDARELASRYDAALERLEDPSFDITARTRSNVEAIASAKNDAAPDPMEHFGRHWLGGDYWPNIKAETVSETVAAGYRDAIRAAKEASLPLNSIWVCATDDSNATTFRVDHCVGPNAVTVAIITPLPASLK
jgi:hypothetical protein